MSQLSLEQSLQSLGNRVRGTGGKSAVVWGVVVTCAAILVAIWLDLVVELPDAFRASCTIIALCMGIAIMFRRYHASKRSSTPRAIASKLDSIIRSGGQVLSGVDLSLSPTFETGTISDGLAQIAVSRASILSNMASPTQLIDPRDLQRPIILLACVGIIVAIAGIFSPRLVGTQAARFFDPFGDHPPFSAISLSVDPGNAKAIYGGSIDIKATTNVTTADRVELVVQSADGKMSEALPMFAEGDNRYRATIASVTSPSQYFIRAGRARSYRYSLGVITVPRFESVLFTITWPSYTNRATYEGPLPQNGIVGLAGTNVELKVKSNRPLNGGKIAYQTSTGTGSHDLTSVAAGANEARGAFDITAAGKISVQLTDVEGQNSTDSFTAQVNVVKDEKPFVRLTEPPANSFATPDATVNAVAVAEDDFGVSKVSIYRAVNQTRPRPVDADVPKPLPTQYPAALPLALKEYGVKPGDAIQLFARVEDNDPAGAKGAESSIVTIHIISQAEMDQLMLAQAGMEVLQSKYAQAGRILEDMAQRAEQLKDELSRLDPKSELADELRKQLEELSKDIDSAADEMEKLADHTLPLDLDKQLSKELKDIADKMREAAKEASKAAKPGMGVAGALDEMKKACENLGKSKEEMKEQIEIPLEYFEKIAPLMEDEARYIELTKNQQELAKRIASLDKDKLKDDPAMKARLRELQDEQAQLQQQLTDLLDDIEAHTAKLPNDERLDELRSTAEEFAKAVRASDADTQIRKSVDALNDFDPERATAAATKAGEILESFIGKCDGMGDQAGECLKFQPSLSQGLGNTLEQMKSMGMGMGRGRGGYSAQRSTLQNVGLYGTVPLRGQQGGGSKRSDAKRGAGSWSRGSRNDNANAQGAGVQDATQAAGESDAAVPPEYRKRVSDYFRRVADELEK